MIRELVEINADQLGQLVRLLIDVVDAGASVGFLPPLSLAEAERYWSEVLGPGVVLLIAEREGQIVGTVQLQLAHQANAHHRAEVARLMVEPHARRRGIGRRLMERVEELARRQDRSLLVLDTREGDPSNELYRSLGYREAGRIPRYARSASGELHSTVYYYKELH